LAWVSDADVILTGVRLNGTFDGIELIRRIRANEATQSKPVSY
jgi:CheY-like chemotaxis protein